MNRPIGKKQFAKLMTSALRDGGVEIVCFNDQDFSLSAGNSKTIYLENVYIRHSNSGREQRQAIIENFVCGMAERDPIPVNFEDAIDQLMPVIRNSAYHSAIRLMLKAKGERHEPLKLKSFVAGSKDDVALLKMLEIGAERLFEPYSLSANLFLLNGAQ